VASDDLEAGLDRVDDGVRSTAPFDLSPRGIRFRPGPELEVAMAEVAARGDSAVPAIADRLEQANALGAIPWLSLLTRIGTPPAAKAIDDFVEQVERENRWAGEFPGPREILLFLGRAEGV
jgi:hypothetical protein